MPLCRVTSSLRSLANTFRTRGSLSFEVAPLCVASTAYTAEPCSSAQGDQTLDTEAVLQTLINHEQQGVPDRAGANGNDGFDLVSSMLLSLSW